MCALLLRIIYISVSWRCMRGKIARDLGNARAGEQEGLSESLGVCLMRESRFLRARAFKSYLECLLKHQDEDFGLLVRLH